MTASHGKSTRVTFGVARIPLVLVVTLVLVLLVFMVLAVVVVVPRKERLLLVDGVPLLLELSLSLIL